MMAAREINNAVDWKLGCEGSDWKSGPGDAREQSIREATLSPWRFNGNDLCQEILRQVSIEYCRERKRKVQESRY